VNTLSLFITIRNDFVFSDSNSSSSVKTQNWTRVHIHIFFCSQWPILSHPKILTLPPESPCIKQSFHEEDKHNRMRGKEGKAAIPAEFLTGCHVFLLVMICLEFIQASNMKGKYFFWNFTFKHKWIYEIRQLPSKALPTTFNNQKF
jgi:hypothetical protein